jgi:hypothetical protein
MAEQEWLSATPTTLLEFRDALEFLKGKVSDRKLRLFAVACCRRIWHLSVPEDDHKAALVAEQFADGQATTAELTEAKELAHEASIKRFTYDPFDAVASLDAFHAASCTATFAAGFGVEDDTADYSYPDPKWEAASNAATASDTAAHWLILRDIFGNPFRPVSLNPTWLLPTVKNLANSIYTDRAFDRMPILADALEDAGCDNQDILNHCRQPGDHVRGCWVVDLVLGKE